MIRTAGLHPYLTAILGAVLIWFSHPPVAAWWLGWLAPAPWLALVYPARLQRRTSKFRLLRLLLSPYCFFWLVGFIHWWALLQGIRLAHWSNYIGLTILSAYLGVYIPLFIGLTRSAVHKGRAPLWLAAPTVWTALELARNYILTGLSSCQLAHTQTENPIVTQIADLFGVYTVSFFVLMPISCVLAFVTSRSSLRLVHLVVLSIAFIAVVSYGRHRLNEPEAKASIAVDDDSQSDAAEIRVAVLQARFDSYLEPNPERSEMIYDSYRDLAQRAVAEWPDVNLIVWPESVYSGTLWEARIIDGAKPVPGTEEPPNFQEELQAAIDAFAEKVRRDVQRINVYWNGKEYRSRSIHQIVGTENQLFNREKRAWHNAALWLKPDGSVGGRYYKNHLVVMGEYIPLGDRFPLLYDIFPSARVTPGSLPASFRINELNVSPTICFESMVPHLLHRQINHLSRNNASPDILINVTNDGWFRKSTILDHHFRSAVFRTIENRRPLMVAANNGITGFVDSSGRIVKRATKGQQSIVFARVRADGRTSLYHTYGDRPVWILLILTTFWAALGVLLRTRTEGLT